MVERYFDVVEVSGSNPGARTMIITIDIETSGIDPEENSILSIGAVIYENPTKQYYGECRARTGSNINDRALEINGFSKEELIDDSKMSEEELVRQFFDWWNKIGGPKTIAGQNIHFDWSFLKFATRRYGIKDSLGYRILDQHSIAFSHLIKNKKEIPAEDNSHKVVSDFIMDYVGIPPEPKPHKALNGAIWETEALGRLMEGRNTLEQFKDYPIPNYLN